MSATLTAPPFLPDGCEYVDGTFRERDRSALASFTAGTVQAELRSHVGRRLGWVMGSGVTYSFPDHPTRARRADVTFHRLDRLTVEQVTSAGHGTVVPDIVVEVVSPHDTADVVNRKRLEWQQAGAAVVWVVFPLDREVHAYYADGHSRVFGPADTLTGEPVLPDFRVPVADIFQLPDA